ncbi:MAG: recombinase family protein [Pseudomonadales bacterium]|nr:recombinase family protein [Pseudomonadales bacterium]
MAVYSYSRTSEIEALENQEHLQNILENERLQVQTFALTTRIFITARFIDQNCLWSQYLSERPEGAQLLNSLMPGDAVIACSLERIFSTCEDMSQTINSFRQRGIKLFIADLNGEVTAADFCPPFVKLMKLFVRLEKRRSRERIKAVKQKERSKGRFLGGSRPFGYMIHSNGRLIENPMEKRVLKKIIELKNQGKSLRAISSAVSTPLVPVSFKTVQRLLQRQAGGQ